jgi:hypothetical protein
MLKTGTFQTKRYSLLYHKCHVDFIRGSPNQALFGLKIENNDERRVFISIENRMIYFRG